MFSSRRSRKRSESTLSETLKNAGFVGGIAVMFTAVTSLIIARMNTPKIAADSRRVDADTETVAVHNAEKVVDLLGKRLDRVELEHANCQRDITELRKVSAGDRRRIARLEQALRDNGIPIPNGET